MDHRIIHWWRAWHRSGLVITIAAVCLIAGLSARCQLTLQSAFYAPLLGPQPPQYNWLTNYTTTSLRSDFGGWLGCYFTADSNITVTALGRWIVSGNSESHTIRLLIDNGSVMAEATINASGATPGAVKYVSIAPITLTNGVQYVLATRENNPGDQWYDAVLTHNAIVQWDFATCDGPAYSADGTTGINYESPGASTNDMYIPVSFNFR